MILNIIPILNFFRISLRIPPSFQNFVFEHGPYTKSRSLDTILVVSGGHDVIVTFYENYVNSQFMVIFYGFREKNLENLKFNRSK